MLQDEMLTVPIPDTSLQIYGVFRDVPRDNAPIVVFTHGKAESHRSLLMYLGARACNAAGFATYRWSLYDSPDDARNLIDCAYEDHVNDLDQVIEYFRVHYPNRMIFVVGHSLGGLVVLGSKAQRFDAAALWDPTPPWWWDGKSFDVGLTRDPVSGMLWSRNGTDILLTERYQRSYIEVDAETLARQFSTPTQLIVSSESGFAPSIERYAQLIAGPVDVSPLEGAGHTFQENDCPERLFEQTITWFNQLIALE